MEVREPTTHYQPKKTIISAFQRTSKDSFVHLQLLGEP
uniref:Uncharacterized protein n=1 Tax=Anguilla anguilla TaxID=7936 RepID=A0A0E9VSM3_ANGAN